MRSFKLCGGGKLKDEAIVAHKGERNLRMTDGLEMNLVLDVAALGVFRAQEFSARRQIVKKRTHFHLRAGRFAAFAHDVDLAAVYHDLGAGDGIRFARRQAKTRNAGDARQRFAAKSERADGFEIGSRADFARGVPFEREQRIVAIHAGAVIDHANERNSAAPNQDVDLARAGVDAVLDQLLHDGSGPLHHFAGRHLAGDGFGQQSNTAHGDV